MNAKTARPFGILRTVAVALAFAASGATAQVTSAPPARVRAAPRPEPDLQYLAMNRQVLDLIANGKYAEAVRIGRQIVDLDPRRPEGHYNLACALARLGWKKDAIAALSEAVKQGYLDAVHMQSDEDLSSLRKTKQFADLVRNVQSLALNGREIPGVRTIRGRPEGGLPYRLRMSETASKERPDRLIVWLHPAGSAMNETVEEMAPMFARRHYALVVFTEKNFALWTLGDGDKLMRTLDGLCSIEGMDADRPIFMGYSAGGQMALRMWDKWSERVGGLILNSAYPLNMDAYASGQMKPMAMPRAPVVRETPVFVVVGSEDGGSAVWQQVEEHWRQQGMPLTVRYVAGKGHSWLFDAGQTAALDKWLEEVAQRPRYPVPPKASPGREPAGARDQTNGPARVRE